MSSTELADFFWKLDPGRINSAVCEFLKSGHLVPANRLNKLSKQTPRAGTRPTNLVLCSNPPEVQLRLDPGMSALARCLSSSTRLSAWIRWLIVCTELKILFLRLRGVMRSRDKECRGSGLKDRGLKEGRRLPRQKRQGEHVQGVFGLHSGKFPVHIKPRRRV